MMFDPVLSDPPLLPVSPKYLLIEQNLGASCTCSVWCVLQESFFPWESACDQHRANQHCPKREVRGSASS
ncbi:unnamed protein product [Staurois parvus]|uniref:Uncharacterized protein n=1 Tax=Staurois parvus TaxID=386267 RepID=A0ABN9DX46_9NEOB|nr:unnamed protein product [Staurois parvus]